MKNLSINELLLTYERTKPGYHIKKTAPSIVYLKKSKYYLKVFKICIALNIKRALFNIHS